MQEEKKTSAREALLEAARRLFAERGYEGVSTRELVEAAGVNLGAIQYHFGSKAKLFVATVHDLVKDTGCDCNSALAARNPLTSQREAGLCLCRFIADLLDYMLHPAGSQPFRLVFREIFTSTSQDPEMFEALISSVVTELIKPVDELLLEVLHRLQPAAGRRELEYAAQSVVSQCAYYVTHGPFVERLRECRFAESPRFEETAMHICRFSLRGLGCREDFIQSVIREAFPGGRPVLSRQIRNQSRE